MCTLQWCFYHGASLSFKFTGTEMQTNDDKTMVCKMCVVGCAVDLVARAPILAMNQFNGLYGCPKCLQKGYLRMLYI